MTSPAEDLFAQHVEDRAPSVAVPIPSRCSDCGATVWYVATQMAWCDRRITDAGYVNGIAHIRHRCPGPPDA